MIIWITGNSGAGKTTLAKTMLDDRTIWLDGDDVRIKTNVGFALTKVDRMRHNITVAKWARLLSDQGFDVIVSLICPYEILRQEVKRITDCKFIYLEFDGDDQIPGKPYEKPKKPDTKIKVTHICQQRRAL